MYLKNIRGEMQKMNKKIIIFSILTIFMLVTISYATAIGNIEKKEKKISPLFKIRTTKALNEKQDVIKDKIIDIFMNFIKDRKFYIPFKFIRIRNFDYRYWSLKCSTEDESTCQCQYNQMGRTNYEPLCLLTLGDTCKCRINNINQNNGWTNYEPLCLLTLGDTCKCKI